MVRAYAVRAGDAHQPRHPPPPRAARGQPAAPHRADERAALLAPGHAGGLLRRRDWDGGQRLPRRSQRGADAHAVERRQERRLLPRGPAEAGAARDPRAGLPLRGRQRGGSSRRTPGRSSGGPSGSSRCASGTPPSAAGRWSCCRHDNPHVLAFVRRYESDDILVVANLSRFVQYVEIDLGAWKGIGAGRALRRQRRSVRSARRPTRSRSRGTGSTGSRSRPAPATRPARPRTSRPRSTRRGSRPWLRRRRSAPDQSTGLAELLALWVRRSRGSRGGGGGSTARASWRPSPVGDPPARPRRGARARLRGGRRRALPDGRRA